jgi:hypothetical protein
MALYISADITKSNFDHEIERILFHADYIFKCNLCDLSLSPPEMRRILFHADHIFKCSLCDLSLSLSLSLSPLEMERILFHADHIFKCNLWDLSLFVKWRGSYSICRPYI